MKLPYVINKRLESIMIILVIFNVIFGLFFYAQFPDQVPTHFDISGNPDQYSGKAFAAFFIPALLLGIYLLLTFLPLADPKRERYKDFSKPYNVIRFLLVVYLTAIYLATSLYALGYPVNIAIFSTTSIGILFIILGNFMPKLKPTWFVGVRTPWTLSDEDVWYKTHRVAGKLFIVLGLIISALAFFPSQTVWVVFMIAMIATIIFLFAYSWWLWRNKQHRKIQ